MRYNLKPLLFVLMLLSSLAAQARIDSAKVFSQAMQREIGVVVVTPKAYDTDKANYPVVYLLHGYSDNWKDWTRRTDLNRLADAYKLIIVCPDGGYGSWYIDSPVDKNSQFETHVSKEVVAFVDQKYRTIAEAKGRAITGLSMGGHGALYLAIRHPETYCAAGSMSGGVDLTYNTKNWEIYKKLGAYEQFPQRWQEHSVVNMVDKLKGRNLAIMVDCGINDFFFGINQTLHKKLLELGIPHDYTERPGKHDWNYWPNALPFQLLFMRQAFDKLAASPAK